MVVLVVIASAVNNIIDVGMLWSRQENTSAKLDSLMVLAPILKGLSLREDPELQGIRAKKSNPERAQSSTITDRGVCKGVHRCLTTNSQLIFSAS